MPYPPSPLLSPATINRLLFILPFLSFFLLSLSSLFMSFSFSPTLISFLNPFDHLPPQLPSSLPSCVHGLFHFISASPSLLSYYIPTSSNELNLIPASPGPDFGIVWNKCQSLFPNEQIWMETKHMARRNSVKMG